MIDKNTNWMEYQENMEVIPHDIMDQVIEAKNNFDPDKYTALDINRAKNKSRRQLCKCIFCTIQK